MPCAALIPCRVNPEEHNLDTLWDVMGAALGSEEEAKVNSDTGRGAQALAGRTRIASRWIQKRDTCAWSCQGKQIYVVSGWWQRRVRETTRGCNRFSQCFAPLQSHPWVDLGLFGRKSRNRSEVRIKALGSCWH